MTCLIQLLSGLRLMDESSVIIISPLKILPYPFREYNVEKDDYGQMVKVVNGNNKTTAL